MNTTFFLQLYCWELQTIMYDSDRSMNENALSSEIKIIWTRKLSKFVTVPDRIQHHWISNSWNSKELLDRAVRFSCRIDSTTLYTFSSTSFVTFTSIQATSSPNSLYSLSIPFLPLSTAMNQNLVSTLLVHGQSYAVRMQGLDFAFRTMGW